LSDGPVVLVRFGVPIPITRALVGDYSLWFQRALGDEPLGVVDLRDPDERLPRDAAAVIIMGSPQAVYDAHPWLARAQDEVRRLLADEVPLLGVCFGHQLLAVARGGVVERNPRGVEVGTTDVHLTPAAARDPLFGEFDGRLRVNNSHDDAVVRLPEREPPTLLGSTGKDPHQVLRWGARAWSVQFHPEMQARETRLAVDWRSPRLASEGGDPLAVRDAAQDSPDGVRLLRRFVALARGAS